MSSGSGPNKLPTINETDRQLRGLTVEALKALIAVNNPPTLFRRCGTLARIILDEAGAPVLEQLSQDGLRGCLTRAANWVKLTKSGARSTFPPVAVVRDILALPERRFFPPLDRLVEAPAFAPNGSLLTTPGYHPSARVWFHAAPGFVVPPVSEHPSPAEIEAGCALILRELFGDFPFAEDASRAHALAATLLPFARDLIEGVTPLHAIDTPTPGTGKGLLANVIGIVATGRGPTVMPPAENDAEWRKRITATLLRAPVFILIDNIRHRLDSESLAGALTAAVWEDRKLGETEIVRAPNRPVWMITGNNLALSNEMARRTAWIRLDAKMEQPWRRMEFRHADLAIWALQNRPALVHACLTLIQAWIVAGRPAGKSVLGSFESWARTIGGILDVAGVPGFLTNMEDLYDQADEEMQEWRTFVTEWWDQFKNKRVGTDDLFNLANEQHMLLDVLGSGAERSQRTRLGKALGKMRDRIIGKYKIVNVDEDNHGLQQYRLQPIGGEQT